MKRLFVSFVFFVFVIQAFSQSNYSQQSYLKLADSLFQSQNYLSAATYYQKAIKRADKPGAIMLQLATCYSKMNQPEEAEKWFRDAEKKDAKFSNNDTYQFADILIILRKRKEAEALLSDLLLKDPDAKYAKFILEDLYSVEKYYSDSSEWKVEPLSINTEYAEFSPEYYREGLVYSSAQPKTFLDKKYHWDGSHFLNLFYSKKIDGAHFEEPQLFEKHLNTQYHDGPVSFYHNFEKMIINRNQQIRLADKDNTLMRQLSLFDAEKISEKDGWKFLNLPFTDAPYIYAHPAVTESGDTLFFVSNMEGGYGGTDIYRVERVKGRWGKPVNLGPKINTHKNEVFPFYVDNTLYFASDGLGGLGGLDIFESVYLDTGFSTPVNLGYPINSSADDFSFIVEPNHRAGYFSSSRSGNDDLYAFSRIIPEINLLAHVYDSATNESIDSARIEIFTYPDSDLNMHTNAEGNVGFSLPEGSTFLIVCEKENFYGMYTGIVDKKSGVSYKTHQIPLTASLSQKVPVTGVITNSDGYLLDEVIITVTDEDTGDTLNVMSNKGMFSFLGDEGKKYKISVKYKDLSPQSEIISVPEGNEKMNKIEIIIDDGSKSVIDMLAHVFLADDSSNVAGASVELITFTGPDQKFTTNKEGEIEFSLPQETAFLLVCHEKKNTGMYTGVVSKESGKTFMIHELPLTENKEEQVPVAGTITNQDGYMLDEVVFIASPEGSEDSIRVLMKNGVFSFLGEKGKKYNIHVLHNDPSKGSFSTTLIVDEDIEKLEIVLDNGVLPSVDLLTHFYKAEDGTEVKKAQVDLITFTGSDQEFTTNESGELEFTLPLETAFLLVCNKDNLTGMYTGVVQKESGKAVMTHEVPLSENKGNKVPVAGVITNKEGYMLDELIFIASPEDSDDSIKVLVRNGVFSFLGEKGKQYTLSVQHPTMGSILTTVTVDDNIEKLALVMDNGFAQPVELLAHFYKAEDNSDVKGATVELVTFTGDDKNLITDEAGKIAFVLPLETSFLLVCNKNNLIGMYTGVVNKETGKAKMVHEVPLVENRGEQVPVAGVVANKDGYMLDELVFIATAEDGEDSVQVLVKNGVFSFLGEKGKKYNIHMIPGDSNGHSNVISIPVEESDLNKLVLQIDTSNHTENLLALLDESASIKKQSDLNVNAVNSDQENGLMSSSNRISSDPAKSKEHNGNRNNSSSPASGIASTAGGASLLSGSINGNSAVAPLGAVAMVSGKQGNSNNGDLTNNKGTTSEESTSDSETGSRLSNDDNSNLADHDGNESGDLSSSENELASNSSDKNGLLDVSSASLTEASFGAASTVSQNNGNSNNADLANNEGATSEESTSDSETGSRLSSDEDTNHANHDGNESNDLSSSENELASNSNDQNGLSDGSNASSTTASRGTANMLSQNQENSDGAELENNEETISEESGSDTETGSRLSDNDNANLADHEVNESDDLSNIGNELTSNSSDQNSLSDESNASSTTASLGAASTVSQNNGNSDDAALAKNEGTTSEGTTSDSETRSRLSNDEDTNHANHDGNESDDLSNIGNELASNSSDQINLSHESSGSLNNATLGTANMLAENHGNSSDTDLAKNEGTTSEESNNDTETRSRLSNNDNANLADHEGNESGNLSSSENELVSNSNDQNGPSGGSNASSTAASLGATSALYQNNGNSDDADLAKNEETTSEESGSDTETGSRLSNDDNSNLADHDGNESGDLSSSENELASNSSDQNGLSDGSNTSSTAASLGTANMLSQSQENSNGAELAHNEGTTSEESDDDTETGSRLSDNDTANLADHDGNESDELSNIGNQFASNSNDQNGLSDGSNASSTVASLGANSALSQSNGNSSGADLAKNEETTSEESDNDTETGSRLSDNHNANFADHEGNESDDLSSSENELASNSNDQNGLSDGSNASSTVASLGANSALSQNNGNSAGADLAKNEETTSEESDNDTETGSRLSDSDTANLADHEGNESDELSNIGNELASNSSDQINLSHESSGSSNDTKLGTANTLSENQRNSDSAKSGYVSETRVSLSDKESGNLEDNDGNDSITKNGSDDELNPSNSMAYSKELSSKANNGSNMVSGDMNESSDVYASKEEKSFDESNGSIFDQESTGSKGSELIILNSDGSSPKYYLLSDGVPSEIIEENGELSIRNQDGDFVFSGGTLDDFKETPLSYLSRLGMPDTEIVALQNIYFDFNSADITTESKQELEKAKKILGGKPYLELIIRAHADDRGRENYNLRLSRKRANAVRSFLMDEGIDKDRMIAQAFGESNPVIPCQVQNCDENDHGKNRRAELSLKLVSEQSSDDMLVSSGEVLENYYEQKHSENRRLSYGDILNAYGDKGIDGLVFKISIGAYRYNPNLTFDELHDLGEVQKKYVSGINYYFLAEFYDLQSAERARKEVIARGIYDAFISIYYNDNIISFATYLKFLKNQEEL